jgi:hypothetical protein
VLGGSSVRTLGKSRVIEFIESFKDASGKLTGEQYDFVLIDELLSELSGNINAFGVASVTTTYDKVTGDTQGLWEVKTSEQTVTDVEDFLNYLNTTGHDLAVYDDFSLPKKIYNKQPKKVTQWKREVSPRKH